MPKHVRTKAKRKLRREPVLASLLAPFVVWVAARVGFNLDEDTAISLTTLALAAAAWYARSKVTPIDEPDLAWFRSRVRVLVNGQPVQEGAKPAPAQRTPAKKTTPRKRTGH